MTERSRFWNGNSVGDATVAPYDAPTEFATVLKALGYTMNMPNQGGVFRNVENQFNLTGLLPNVVIDTGMAMVDGIWYENQNSLSLTTIVNPLVSTRIDLVVLRKDWTAQTVRLVWLPGVEGGAAPTLTQIVGITWDIPLWQFSTTILGAITSTDLREFIGGVNGNVGAANVPAYRYVPLIPSLLDFHAAIPGNVNISLNLPGGIPAHAVAISVDIRVDVTSGGSCRFSSNADSQWQVTLNVAPDSGAGSGYTPIAFDHAIVNIDKGTPCTILFSRVGSTTTDITFVINGYFEPIA